MIKEALQKYQSLIEAGFSKSTYIISQIAVAYHNIRGLSRSTPQTSLHLSWPRETAPMSVSDWSEAKSRSDQSASYLQLWGAWFRCDDGKKQTVCSETTMAIDRWFIQSPAMYLFLKCQPLFQTVSNDDFPDVLVHSDLSLEVCLGSGLVKKMVATVMSPCSRYRPGIGSVQRTERAGSVPPSRTWTPSPTCSTSR